MIKLTFKFPKVKKGGPGSGHHGHSGRPGKVGGSSADSLGGLHLQSEGFYDVYVRRSPDGFEERYIVRQIGNSDEYEVYTHKYGDLYAKDIPVYLSGKVGRANFPNGGSPASIVASSKIDALEKGLVWEESNKVKLQQQLDKKIDGKSRIDKIHEYQYRPDKVNIKNVAREVVRDRIAFEQAKQQLDRFVTFDSDGYVTLYRGGSKTGLSWSTLPSEAERFARYGFGGVDARISGMVGVRAIMQGADQNPVEIHERRFHRNQLLTALPGSEHEVIVLPSVFEE